jgi:pimeloyl-ACP methyl ester carboxylesterase
LSKINKIFGDIAKKPALLFLQGGSKSSDIFIYLAKKLEEQKIGSLLFDHSGFGNSPDKKENSSLEIRLNEAITASKHLRKPLNICAFSMAGSIGLKMLEKCQVNSLILFCPGIYTKDAFKVNFGPQFTNIIKQFESWKNSDIFKPLSKFNGKLLIIIGDQDEIIPTEIIKLLDTNSPHCSKKEIIHLPNCTHSINEYLENNPEKLNLVASKINEYL